MPRPSLIVVIALPFLTGSVCAHEDPVGDIHPKVSVEDGNFAVYFFDTTAHHKKTGPIKHYRTLIDSEGRVLASRKPVAERIVPLNLDALDVVADPASLRFGGLDTETPPLARADGGKTHFMDGQSGDLFSATCPAGWILGQFSLRGTLSNVHRHAFTIDSFDTLDGHGGHDFPLTLGAFDLKAQRFVTPVVLGNPARIFLPVRSRILVAGDEAFVAWCEERDLEIKNEIRSATYQVVLSRWRIGTPEVGHVVLRQACNDNMSISMERLGRRILVAWHEGIGTFGAKVYTALTTLDTAEFRPDIALGPPSTFLDDMEKGLRGK